MKPPRAYALASFISSAQSAEAPSFALRASAFADEGRRVPLAHSSMDLRPWSSAKADKVRLVPEGSVPRDPALFRFPSTTYHLSRASRSNGRTPRT